MKFRINDKVKIIDIDDYYSSYDDWSKKYNLKNWVKNDELPSEKIGKVIATGKHLNGLNNLVAVKINGQDYIFQEEGLALIETEKDKGTFMWAVEQMKQGKKVRRKAWQGKEIFAIIESDFIRKYNYWQTPKLDYNDFKATDWEIFEENNIMKELIEECSSSESKSAMWIDREKLEVFLEKAIKKSREIQNA